jgi:flavin-binding protein dodecin
MYQKGGDSMAVAKIIEISAGSDRSFEDAIRKGIERASNTVQNIQGAWIKEQKLEIEGGKVKEYRVDMKVTFLLQ